MIDKTTKKTILFNDLSEENQNKMFDVSMKKFIHNIDSLYYVVKIKGDWNTHEGCKSFVYYLKEQKEECLKTYEPYVLEDLGTEYLMNGIGSANYRYDIEKKDKYIIFLMHNQINPNTPELWVQIRSQFLWTYGEYRAVEESIKDVESILAKYKIEIEEIKENRIDYAYHTNYIQDPLSFFKIEDLNKMQVSRFKRWSLEGCFVGEWDMDLDYITLGRKKSNNLFFRIYNKTKEVIEQGYKQFFIKLWYLEKMINFYDMYCIEKAFENSSYDYLDVARLEFYVEHGKNKVYKQQIKELINTNNYDYKQIRKLANQITPKVTLVCNVEIETKRKYYKSLDNSVDTLLKVKSKCPSYANKLYIKLDNKQLFHNLLTCKNEKQEGVIRFIDYKAKNKFGKGWTRKSKYPTATWWKRLQAVKVNRKFKEEDVQLIREYQKNLDEKCIKRRLINTVSTYKLYKSQDVESSLAEDLLDFISGINESDTQKAIEYKKKKIALLGARLKDVNKTDCERIYTLLNLETGEILD